MAALWPPYVRRTPHTKRWTQSDIPVVYFSTSILRKVFKANAALLALSILFVKFPASLCTIPVLPVSRHPAQTRAYLLYGA